MTPEQLITFATVAEHGNISRATVALHLSQPAVSDQLKLLQDEFGEPLYLRDGPGHFRLTASGEHLLGPAEWLRETFRAAHALRGLERGTADRREHDACKLRAAVSDHGVSQALEVSRGDDHRRQYGGYRRGARLGRCCARRRPAGQDLPLSAPRSPRGAKTRLSRSRRAAMRSPTAAISPRFTRSCCANPVPACGRSWSGRSPSAVRRYASRRNLSRAAFRSLCRRGHAVVRRGALAARFLELCDEPDLPGYPR
ncbi:LysR family transcriptional regulator YeiE [Candidatus Burkholderia brachyanthoides]|nr:LysR family transcriptional regulator YeiE [Candidatus Burkholderia brachyanthoides]